MATETVRLDPIGIAHTPFGRPEDAPPQGFAGDEESTIEIFERYAAGLADMDAVHRITVLYWCHLGDRRTIDGVFARRSPNRPNPIGLCACLVLGVAEDRIRVRGLDAVDGSPVLDIKPSLQAER